QMQDLELLLDRRRAHRRRLEPVTQRLVVELDPERRFLPAFAGFVPVVDEIAVVHGGSVGSGGEEVNLTAPPKANPQAVPSLPGCDYSAVSVGPRVARARALARCPRLRSRPRRAPRGPRSCGRPTRPSDCQRACGAATGRSPLGRRCRTP